MKLKSLYPIVIALAAIAVYINALPNDFVWDDRPLVIEDYHIRSAQYLDDIFTRDFFSHSDNELKYGYYRPIITLSYMTDLAIWGLNPMGFHTTNIFFHTLCSLLVYCFALRLFCGRKEIGLIAALLFAVHPIHTESVTWIAGRTDVIATFFILSTLCLHLRGRKYWSRSLAILCATFAILAKEMALVIPALIFLLELIHRDQDNRNERVSLSTGKPWVRALRNTIPYIVVVILYFVWRNLIVRIAYTSFAPVSLFTLILSAIKTFWLYALKLIWPIPLVAYIQNPYTSDLLTPGILLALALSLLLLFAFWKTWHTNRVMFFLLGTLAVCFAPLSNFIKISAPFDMGFPMSERFLYLPSVFFVIILAVLLTRYIRSKSVLITVISMVFIFWAILTFARNRVWRNEETFLIQTIKQAPDAPLLHANLGKIYALQGKHKEAAEHLETAIRLNKSQVLQEGYAIQNNLAAVEIAAGHYEEAVKILKKLILADPGVAEYHYNLGRCLLAQNYRFEAKKEFDKALVIRPNYIDAMTSLAELFEYEDNFFRAAEYYAQAIKLFPRSVALHLARGVAFKNSGLQDEAIQEFATVLRLNPKMAPGRGNMGVAYAMKGDFDAAKTNLLMAIEMNPELWDAQNALGMVYSMQGNQAAAWKKFKEILKKDPSNTEALLNEGILFYREKDLDAARKKFMQVIKIDPYNEQAGRFLNKLGPGKQENGG